MAKILVIGNPYMNYTSALYGALVELGHTVSLWPSNLDLFDRRKCHGQYLLKAYINKKNVENRFYNLRINKLKQYIGENDIDIFIYFNGRMRFDYMNADIAALLKSKNVKMIVWYMDAIKYCKYSNKTLAYYDEIYSFEKEDTAEYAKYGINVKYLPIGIDTAIYCSNDKISNNNSKKYDLCFIGSATKNRLNLLEKVAKYVYNNDLKMIVYGRWWNKRHWWTNLRGKLLFKIKYPYLYKYVNNKSIMPQETAQLYVNTKISLNIHTSIHGGINPRTFEILGNGNFELCDFREDFEILGLKDGEHLAIYKNVEECIEKMDYYLKNDAVRERVGANGLKIAIEKYTMKEIIRKGMNL